MTIAEKLEVTAEKMGVSTGELKEGEKAKTIIFTKEILGFDVVCMTSKAGLSLLDYIKDAKTAHSMKGMYQEFKEKKTKEELKEYAGIVASAEEQAKESRATLNMKHYSKYQEVTIGEALDSLM